MQQRGPLRELRLVRVGNRLELLHDGVRRVDLEDALLLRQLVARVAEDALHVRAHAMLVADEARGRVRETVRDADFLDLVVEGLVHAREHGRQILLLLLLVLLLFLRFGEVERALCCRNERRAIELAQHVDDPLVDRIDEEEHFAAVLLERLDVRAALCGGQAVGGHVVDRLLALGHARLVVGKAGQLRMRRAAVSQ